MRKSKHLALCAFVIGVSACSGDDSKTTPPGPSECVPGESKACTGPGGCQGGQICSVDGKSFGLCDCSSSGLPEAGANDGSVGNGGAGTGATSSTSGGAGVGGTSSTTGGTSSGGNVGSGGLDGGMGGVSSSGGAGNGGAASSSCAGGSVIKCGNGVKDPGEICYLPPQLVPYTMPSSSYVLQDLAVANLDGTGLPEVVALVTNYYFQLHIFSADGAGVYSDTKSVNVASGAGTPTTPSLYVTLGELTGDANMDALVTYGQQYVSSLHYPYRDILAGDGAGSFGSPSTTQISTQYSTGLPVGTLGDANGDGLLDLFVSNGVNSMTVQLASSAGVFGTASTTLSGGVLGHVHLSDLTGDGHPEILGSNGGLSIGLNDGNGVYSFWSKYLSGTVVNRPMTAQMDGDGLLDIVFGTSTDGVRVFLGNGFGGVIGGSQAHAVAPGNVIAAFPVDVTNDGCMDIVAFNEGGVLTVLPALDYGIFETYRTYPGLTGPIQMGDFNGDGLMDFVSADSKGVGFVLSNP